MSSSSSKRRFLRGSGFLFVWTLGFSISPGLVAVPVYQTGFEAAEVPPFSVGSLPQNGWVDQSPPSVSEVTSGLSFSGAQSLCIAPNGILERPVAATAAVIYIDSWYRPQPGSEWPSLAAMQPSSALFIFHATSGLQVLDGDGTGGGTWTATGLSGLSGFHRITLRLNFGPKEWDLFVDEVLVGRGLGFKDDSVTSLSGLRIKSPSAGQCHLDDVIVGVEPPPFVPQDEIWVDFAYSGLEAGSIDQPFSTLAPALLAVAHDGVIRIKGNTATSETDETPRITQKVRLTSVSGTVRIGVPTAKREPLGPDPSVFPDDLAGLPFKGPDFSTILRILADRAGYKPDLNTDFDGKNGEDGKDLFAVTLQWDLPRGVDTLRKPN